MKRIEEVYESTVVEKDEHRKSKAYRKLSPKMRKAVDEIFKIMDAKPSDFLNTFEKTIQEVSKKFGVTSKQLMSYFEKEMLTLQELKMAAVLQEIVDSDFEYFVKITTTGTNSSTAIFDASDAVGAATDPRTTITGVAWSVASTTDIEWDATSNVVALSLNGSGKVGFGDGVPSIPNSGGSGVTGDLAVSNASASVGTIWLRMKKVSGYDNIT